MARIIWNRVGSNYTEDPTDISDALDLEKLQTIVETEVGNNVQGRFNVHVELKVELDGGESFTLPFGRGDIAP